MNEEIQKVEESVSEAASQAASQVESAAVEAVKTEEQAATSVADKFRDEFERKLKEKEEEFSKTAYALLNTFTQKRLELEQQFLELSHKEYLKGFVTGAFVGASLIVLVNAIFG